MQANIRKTYASVYATTGSRRPIAPLYKSFSKAWGWYKVVADIARGSLLNFDAVTSLPATQVLTFLQYEKDKDAADEAQHKLDKLIAKNKGNANS